MPTYDLRLRYAETLIAHQRLNIESCRCGWGVDAGNLGQSHAVHVVEELMAVRDEEMAKLRESLGEMLADHEVDVARIRDRAKRAEAAVERVRRLAAEMQADGKRALAAPTLGDITAAYMKTAVASDILAALDGEEANDG